MVHPVLRLGRPATSDHAPANNRHLHGDHLHGDPLRESAIRHVPRPASPAGPGGVDVQEADDFLRNFHRERPRQAGPLLPRLNQVRREIADTGTYHHTRAELEYGARVAWRNSSRCIGRLHWQSLRVVDCREVHGATAIAASLVAHLREATNDGRIRPTISVFAPDAPARPGPRVWNEQLVRYAGYRQPDGSVVAPAVAPPVRRRAAA